MAVSGVLFTILFCVFYVPSLYRKLVKTCFIATVEDLNALELEHYKSQWPHIYWGAVLCIVVLVGNRIAVQDLTQIFSEKWVGARCKVIDVCENVNKKNEKFYSTIYERTSGEQAYRSSSVDGFTEGALDSKNVLSKQVSPLAEIDCFFNPEQPAQMKLNPYRAPMPWQQKLPVILKFLVAAWAILYLLKKLDARTQKVIARKREKAAQAVARRNLGNLGPTFNSGPPLP